MKLRVLASGSRGNAALVWAAGKVVLVDAGLPVTAMTERLVEARLGLRAIDHVLVTHGHLDHSRTAGIIAKRHGASLHAPAEILEHRSLARAPQKEAIPIGVPFELGAEPGAEPIRLHGVPVPHDCHPTLALRLEHGGRALGVLTDCGEPAEAPARALGEVDVLMLEANHDADLLRSGPYPEALKARVQGPGGHLSNDQMAVMLRRLVCPRLHTVVLIHLSETNNRQDLALATARSTLGQLGREDVRVVCAEQHRALETLEV